MMWILFFPNVPGDPLHPSKGMSLYKQKWHCSQARQSMQKSCSFLLSILKVLVFLDRLTCKLAWGAGLELQNESTLPSEIKCCLRMGSQKQSRTPKHLVCQKRYWGKKSLAQCRKCKITAILKYQLWTFSLYLKALITCSRQVRWLHRWTKSWRALPCIHREID